MGLSMSAPTTKPYLIRALYEWCSDNGFTPYLAVSVDRRTRVPLAHVKEGEITLNIGAEATQHLELGNEDIRFAARFGGVATDILVPVSQVLAIYARENGVGMGFEVEAPVAEAVEAPETESESPDLPDGDPPTSPARGKPALKRVK